MEATCAGSLGDFAPPSPPAEKATARCDQTGQASTGDGAGDGAHRVRHGVIRYLCVD